MNEIKIYLKPSGSLAYLYKDFDLYEGCYRNSQLTVFVPKSLLYENENGTFVNLVKTGAILTAPNGSKLTTKSYYLDYEREQTIGGVEFSVYTMITPKEFCVYAGTQTVVVNVESIDNTNPDAQMIISVTTTQTADLIVLESAYLGQDEPIDPTELDKIKATLTEIQSEIGDLPNKYVPRSSGRHIVYVNDINGNPSTQIYAVDASGNIIVQRDGNGQIKVPLAPAQDDDATSKKYVDESIEALPSKYVTLDTDQTIDGKKDFTSPITVGGQTWHTSYMKDSFVYTVDGNNYEVTYPEKSGLMALKSDIPTDYATQSQLAQTNQNVEDLYTILEQAQVVTVTTLEQAYTTRETADGENIVDGVQTTVKEIRGKTVATENLIPYPYAYPTDYTNNGVTFTVNSDGTITANGTATGGNALYYLSSLYTVKTPEKSYLSGCPSGGGSTTFSIQAYTREQIYFSDIGSGFLAPANVEINIVLIVANGYTANNLIFRPMLNVGTEAKPYSKWFAGLKNAYFEKIVSTGKNLNGGESVLVNKLIENVTTGIIVDYANYNTLLLPVKSGETYRLTGYTNNSGVTLRYVIYDQSMNVITYNSSEAVVTIPESGAYLGCSYYNQNVEAMCERGATATAYEPYISDTLSAETPIELPEYDVAYPETGETKRQSNTLTFDGTENWNEVSSDTRYQYIFTLPVLAENDVLAVISNLFVTNSDNGISLIGETSDGMTSVRVRGNKTEHPEFDTLDKWKAFLAAQSAAGNPLTVTYKTAEATTEATPFNKSKYIAWKNGSETIEQGSTDNSEYGAENTVKQDYFTLTGGTTNV